MIKILKDNNRLVIIVEDSSIDIDKFAKEVAMKAVTYAIPVEQQIVEGLISVKQEEENIEEIINGCTEVCHEPTIVEPIQLEEEIKFNKGSVKETDFIGKTPEEVLYMYETVEENDNTCVSLYCQCNNINDKKLKKELIRALKKYLSIRLNISDEKMANIKVEEIKHFLTCYEPIIQGEINSILQQSGFIDLKAFLENTEELNLKSAYYATAENLIKRLKL